MQLYVRHISAPAQHHSIERILSPTHRVAHVVWVHGRGFRSCDDKGRAAVRLGAAGTIAPARLCTRTSALATLCRITDTHSPRIHTIGRVAYQVQ